MAGQMGGLDPKEASLEEARAINPYPDQVTDPEFLANAFFDPRDAVQVKYEMLRMVKVGGASIAQATRAFGLSRNVYRAASAALEQSGVAGLVPARPGPHGWEMLTDEICAWAEEQLAADPQLRPGQLVRPLEETFGVRTYSRSIERALRRYRERHPKGR